jgi:PASTA domain-containing protein
MASTVKVPLLGTHKKGTVIGVGIGGVTVAGYLIWRNQKKANAQQAATDQAEASSGYGYGILPQGFYGYGEPGGAYGYGASGGFYPQGYYGYGAPLPPTGNIPVTTNAQWTQAAVTQLQQDGYQSLVVLKALGKYINGVAVDANETTIVQAAIAVEGYPPQAGKNGNPPGIVHGGGGGGDGQGRKQVTVPNVKGKLYPAAATLIKARGLVPERVGRGIGVIADEEPDAGTKVEKGSKIRLSTAGQLKG